MYSLCRISFVFVCLFLAVAAVADIENGYQWLSQQQQTTGVIKSQEKALDYQSTFEAFNAYKQFDRDLLDSYWLGLSGKDTETVSCSAMYFEEQDNAQLGLQILLSRQNFDGGFGHDEGFSSTPYDTYWALAAFYHHGFDSVAVSHALSYLLDQQNADGGWGYPESFSSVQLTARITDLLARLRIQYPTVQGSLDLAVGFLLSSISLDASSSEKSLVLKALSNAGASIDVVSGIAASLVDDQSNNGSWNSSVYDTALALLGLHAFGSNNALASDKEISSITGRIVTSGSTEPISDVTIALVDKNEKSASTNHWGEYTLTQLPLGTHTLLVSKPGYYSVTKAITLVSGDVTELEAIALQPAVESAMLVANIYDEVSRTPVSGATITLSGEKNYVIQTDDNGEYSLPDIKPGTYQTSIITEGFHALSTEVNAHPATVTRLNQGIVPEGAVLDNSPQDLTGRIVDGDSGSPVKADITLDTDNTTVTDNQGYFTIPQVSRGDYKLSVMADGYKTTSISFNLPSGATGNLGDISIYPVAVIESPVTLDLLVSVKDAVSKSPLEEVQLDLQELNVKNNTDASGNTVFSGLELLDFNILLSKPGYISQKIEVKAGGYGETAIKLFMTPVSESNEAWISLSGQILNADDDPIENATVKTGSSQINTDADGQFRIEGIESLSFTVQVDAPGYLTQELDYALQEFGDYSTDIILESAPVTQFNILAASSLEEKFEAYSLVELSTKIENLQAESDEVVIRGQVFDLSDKFVTEITALVPGTSLPESRFMFEAEEVRDIAFNWNVRQASPGTYRIQIDIVEKDSISRNLPQGIVMARHSVFVEVIGEAFIEGGIQFEPPLVQAGTQGEVDLKAIVRNVGNMPISQGEYQILITAEDGTVLHTATTEATLLPMNNIIELDFGSWLPETPGHHTVMIQHTGYANLSLESTYYVGDVASGKFSLAKQIFLKGDHATQASIELKGVDVSSATVSDELFERVKTAVRQGGEYAGYQGVIWDKRNRCLGCHIQSQAVYGLASANDFVDVNQDNLKYLVNTLTTASQDDGAVRNDHKRYKKTQTGFALWALSEWKDKMSSFMPAYRAAQFMFDHRSQSGSSVYWNKDHNTGWFRNRDGMTWAVAKGMADVLRASASEEVENMKVPSLDHSSAIPLMSALPNIIKMSESEDGQSMLVSKFGAVEKVTPSENKVEIIYTTDNYARDAIELDGRLYIIDVWDLVVVDDEGQISRYPQEYRVNDLQVMEGEIYGAALYDNRIVRLNKSLNEFVTYKTSPLFNFPESLTLTDDGDLLITNRRSYNILKLSKSKELSVYADGMSYQPIRITSAGNGKHFISTIGDYRSLHLLHNNGVVERLFDNNHTSGHDFQGLAVIDGKLYTGLRDANLVVPLKSDIVDLSAIEDVKAALQGVANYYDRSNEWSTPREITRLAFRLMALKEASTVITDSEQQALIQNNISGLAAKIRSYQRSDGGWGRYKGHGSDPTSTAIMGLALDYTNPSADDAASRKAITYLLSNQRPDGSWAGQYYPSRLGVTSFVMAYLPRALQRLGGLDVGVNLEVPADIELSDISIEPESIAEKLDGSRLYNWDMEGVTSSGQNISFTMLFRDLLVDEVRPAANIAGINFANSFNDEQMTVPLAIPNVTAVTRLGLLLATDKTAYGANETVTISSVVSNMGPQFNEGLLTVEIRQAGFGHTVEILSSETVLNLAREESLTVNYQWQTGVIPAGDYVVHATVLDSKGHIQVEDSQAITILPSSGGVNDGFIRYTLSAGTDKYEYQAFDQVSLSTRVRNQAVNTINDPVLARLVVTDPDGNEFFRSSHVASEMTANGQQTFADKLYLDDVKSGIYQINATLWNADVTEKITAIRTEFKVSENQLSRVKGKVSISSSNVAPGESLTCTDTVINRSSMDLHGVTVRTLLVSTDPEEELVSEQALVGLSPAQHWISSRDIDTSALEEGNYACVLVAEMAGNVYTLSYTGFVVEIKVDYSLNHEIGKYGRWLILHDPAQACAGYDYHQHKSKKHQGHGKSCAERTEQQATEEAILHQLFAQAGASYTLVNSADTFKTELYSGQYTAYGLFSEKVTLHPDVEQVLAEAVYQGAGLLLNEPANRRNNHLEKALGISVQGRQRPGVEVSIEAGNMGNAETLRLLPQDALDINRQGADVLAEFISTGKHNACHNNKQCPGGNHQHQVSGNPAIVSFSYGDGHSISIAFDALADAADIENNDQQAFHDLLRYSIDTVQPSMDDWRVGQAIPVMLHTENFGMAVDTRMRFSLASNAELIEAEGWHYQNEEWLMNQYLEEEAVLENMLYLKLLDDTAVDLAFISDYQLLEEEWQAQAQTVISLQSQAYADVHSVQAELQQLLAESPYDKKLGQLSRQLDQADQAIEQGDYRKALSSLLHALAMLEQKGHARHKRHNDADTGYPELHKLLGQLVLKVARKSLDQPKKPWT